MSPLQRSLEEVVALSFGDGHFSLKPPVARTAEKDWLEAQFRSLKQLKELQIKYQCPVLFAGDLTHHWDEPAELISFLLTHLPHLYAVPGQHDLAYHSYGDLYKSAFGALVKAGRITLLEPGNPLEIPGRHPLRLWGFPWGVPLKPLQNPSDLLFEIAVVHAMIWTKKSAYPGAPQEKHLSSYTEALKGYDLAIFGDNHKSFYVGKKEGKRDCIVINNGAFQRRTNAEKHHKPRIALIHADGEVSFVELDTRKDKFLDVSGLVEILDDTDLGPLLESLNKVADAAIDFEAALKQFLLQEGVSPEAKKIALRCLEKRNG